MGNALRDMLQSHAAKGYTSITANEPDMVNLYRAFKAHLYDRLERYVKSSNTGFTGRNFVALDQEIQSMFPELEASFRANISNVVPYLAQSYYHSALVDLSTGGTKTVTGSISKDQLDLILKQNFSDVAGATRKMSDIAVQSLRNIAAQTMRQARMTGASRKEVSKQLYNAAGGPAFIFTARNGAVWDGETYFTMLGRTMLNNNARESYMDSCIDQGNDIVEVSTSGNPCKYCAPYEGMLLSITGKTPGLQTVAEAIKNKLLHPNCTHRFTAVPPEIAAKYYDASGNPQKEQDIAPEKKESSGKLKKAETTVPETTPGLSHGQIRQEQWLRAYDNRRDKWVKSITGAGGSKAIAGALADCYTPGVAKHGKPPKIVFKKFGKNDGACMVGKEIHISADINDWNGNISTARHEFFHYVDRLTRWKNPKMWDDRVQQAASLDWDAFIKRYSSNISDFKPKKIDFQKLSLDFLGKDIKLATLEERGRLMMFTDTIGSLSEGAYGGGHSAAYYRQNIPNVEAIANIGAAQMGDWKEFKTHFPNLWEILLEMRK